MAPCSWGVYWPEGNDITWAEYLGLIADAGYRHTELGPFGFGPTEPQFLNKSLAIHGISLTVAAHVHTLADATSFDVLAERTEKICSLLAASGGQEFILMDESEYYPEALQGVVTEAGWRNVLCGIDMAAQIANSHGIVFSVHPHVGTCIETEAQIERLLSATNPNLVNLCLDYGHHAFWDADPLAFFAKHRARISSVHLKNVDAQVRKKVLAGMLGVNESFDHGIMTDLAEGAVDIAAAVVDLVRTDFGGPVTVEQDLNPQDARAPEVIAVANLDYLRKAEAAVAD